MFKVILYDVLSWGWQFPLNAPTILELQVTFQWMYQPHHDICAQIALLQKKFDNSYCAFWKHARWRWICGNSFYNHVADLLQNSWCLRGFNKYCSLLKMDKQQFCSLLLAAKTVFSCPSVFQVSNSNKIINKFLKIISQPWPTFFQ